MVKIRISICKVVKWDFSWDFQTLSKSEWVKKMNFSSTVPKKLHFFTLVGLFFVFNFDISHMSILQNWYQKKEAITIKASEIEIFLIFWNTFSCQKILDPWLLEMGFLWPKLYYLPSVMNIFAPGWRISISDTIGVFRGLWHWIF